MVWVHPRRNAHALTDDDLVHPRQANASVTPAPSCQADCNAFEPIVGHSWFPIQITANFTYATVILIVDERTNQTITSTKTNALPDGVTMPPTNAAGTHVSTITYETAVGKSTTTVL